MTWCFPDENHASAGRVLELLAQARCIVPGLWHIEIANALLMGERRRRLTRVEVTRFLSLIGGLAVEVDPAASAEAARESLSLARTYDLTVYDATYLELAVRRALPLATLDPRLAKAAHDAGAVPL